MTEPAARPATSLRPGEMAVIAVPCIVAVGALATLHPFGVLGLLAALILLVIMVPRPAIGLVALFALEPFWGAFYTYFAGKHGVHFGPLTLWKDALIGGLLLRAVAYDFWKTRQVRWPKSRLDRLLIFYVLFYVVQTGISPSLRPAEYDTARIIEGPLLALGILYLRPSRRLLLGCAAALVGAAAVIGAAALIEHFGPHAKFQTWYGAPRPANNSSFYGTQGKNYRAGSFLDSPLTLAFYEAAAGPFALGLAIAVKSRWKPLAVLAVGLCFGGLIVTVTRSGYIGGGLGLIAAIVLGIQNKVRRVTILLFVAASAAIVVGGYIASGNQALLRSHENVGKSGSISNDIDHIVAQPFGQGMGTTDYVAERFQQLGGGVSTESEFLAKAVEGGVAALGLYLVVMFSVLMRLVRVRRSAVRERDPPTVALTAGAFGAVLGLMGASLFLGIEELVVEVVVWGAVGIALAYAAAPSDQQTAGPDLAADDGRHAHGVAGELDGQRGDDLAGTRA